MRTPLVLGLFTLASLGGCTSGGTPGSQAGRYDRHRITEAEIQAQPPGNAFQIIQALRPAWLRGRAATYRSDIGRHSPMVFLDQRPLGSLDTLQEISSVEIAEMEFISASDATTRFGTGYPAGIISVTLKRLAAGSGSSS